MAKQAIVISRSIVNNDQIGAHLSGGEGMPWPWKSETIEGQLPDLMPEDNNNVTKITAAQLVGHTVRYIKSGDLVILNYMPDRINIVHDDHGMIIAVYNG